MHTHDVRNTWHGKEIMKAHSTVTSKGQTTIPVEIRDALQIKTGDRLEFLLEGDRLSIRVHPGAAALAGILSSDKGKGMSFDQIRAAALESARRKNGLTARAGKARLRADDARGKGR
jgi:AbrB family looped-hinge helix DNA binding protein